jgi:hypothetical protein
MVILVTGGQDFDDYATVDSVLEDVFGWSTTAHNTLVTNNSGRGAAALAIRWAKEHGGEKVIQTPFATAEQRQAAIDVYKPEQGVVFAGGNETEDMLLRLFRAGINVWAVGK